MSDRIGADSELAESISSRLEQSLERGLEHPFHEDALALLLEALESPRGCFIQLDEFQEPVVLAARGLTLAAAASGLWAQTLHVRTSHAFTEPHLLTPQGPSLSRALSAPILFGGEPIGLLYAADKPREYGPRDHATARALAHRVAPYLFARNSQQHFRRQLNELEYMADAAAEGERFFMLAGDMMAIMDERLLRTNTAFANQLGWDAHDLRERSLADLVHPADRDALLRDLAGLRSQPNRERPPIVVRMLAKDGSCHSIEWTGTATDEGRIYAVGRNVSELRSAVARLAAQNEELRLLHEQVRHEQSMAGQLLANVRRIGSLDIPGVRHLTTPLDFFNGDIALASVAKGGELRWLLGDFTGHGLSAAVGTMPIASTFYATSKKGVPLRETVATINDLLKSLLPAGLFCAAALLSLDREQRTLTVWNGGLPSIIVRSARDGSLRELTSQSLPFGLVSSSELTLEPSVIEVANADEVFVYSDGVSECQNVDGELFGQARVLSVLGGPSEPGHGFDRLVREVRSWKAGAPAGDDLSLIVVTVGAVSLPDDATVLQRRSLKPPAGAAS